MSSSLVSSLAKVYDPKVRLGQKPTTGKMFMEPDKPTTLSPAGTVEPWVKSLADKMDRLLKVQEKVLRRLDGMSQDIGGIEKHMEVLKMNKEELRHQEVLGRATEVKEMCHEMTNIMSAVNERSEQQSRKLEGMEKLVLGLQQVVGFLGHAVKNSSLTELIFKGDIPQRKSAKEKNSKKGKGKPLVSNKKSNKVMVVKQMA
ncbi:myosin light chain kinase 3-like [Arapaima gigas]